VAVPSPTPVSPNGNQSETDPRPVPTEKLPSSFLAMSLVPVDLPPLSSELQIAKFNSLLNDHLNSLSPPPDDNQSATGSLSTAQDFTTRSESPDPLDAPDLSKDKPALPPIKRGNRRQVGERPSIYNTAASPASGPVTNQSSTSSSLVPSRRLRSQTSSIDESQKTMTRASKRRGRGS